MQTEVFIREDLGYLRNYIRTQGSGGMRAHASASSPGKYFQIIYQSYTADYSQSQWLAILDLLEELVVYFFATFIKDGKFKMPSFLKWFAIGNSVVGFVKALIDILRNG